MAAPIPDGRLSGPNDCEFTIGVQAGNDVTVACQLKTGLTDIKTRALVWMYLSSDANGDTVATAPAGGVAAGTDGTFVVEATANVVWAALSEADGDIDVVLTEAGSGTWYLNVILPDGHKVTSGAIAIT
jgi:hypothetical protein